MVEADVVTGVGRDEGRHESRDEGIGDDIADDIGDGVGVLIEQLNFSYGSQRLFRDTGLVLVPGNIYGLLGLNGAGKSTLLQLMAGLLFADEGSLNVLGVDPAQRAPDFLNKLFFLPETFVVPGITDEEYIMVNAAFYPAFDHRQMQRLLSEFEVPRGVKLNKLSHGQQKKFLLSFGLSCNALLLILDEPTNGLDIPSKGLFRRLVAESLSDRQIFVVSTHQVSDLESLLDSIVILHQGRVLFNQTVGKVSESLRMSVSSSRPQTSDDLLYCEPTLGGFASVTIDNNAADNRLDLELLFKAVLANPEVYPNLFNQARSAHE